MNTALRNALRVAGYESWGEIPDANLAAVRRSAITEAVDRLTAREVLRLAEAMEYPATVADMRQALRRALTEGT
jgi:hypothetical protein